MEYYNNVTVFITASSSMNSLTGKHELCKRAFNKCVHVCIKEELKG